MSSRSSLLYTPEEEPLPRDPCPVPCARVPCALCPVPWCPAPCARCLRASAQCWMLRGKREFQQVPSWRPQCWISSPAVALRPQARALGRLPRTRGAPPPPRHPIPGRGEPVLGRRPGEPRRADAQAPGHGAPWGGGVRWKGLRPSSQPFRLLEAG